MKISPLLATFAGFAVMLAIAPLASGDAPCNKGYRDTTPADRERLAKIVQKIAAIVR